MSFYAIAKPQYDHDSLGNARWGPIRMAAMSTGSISYCQDWVNGFLDDANELRALAVTPPVPVFFPPTDELIYTATVLYQALLSWHRDPEEEDGDDG